MLDAFEIRLVDLLADRLAHLTDVQVVTRPRDGLSALSQVKARVTVRLTDGHSCASLGDDEPDARAENGNWELKPIIRLRGKVLVQLEMGIARSNPSRQQQRSRLIGCMDEILAVLNDESIRKGTAFSTQEDLGFEIDGFRLANLGAQTESKADMRRFEITYEYSGSFWPVEPAVEGDSISSVLTRMAVLPATLPRNTKIKAGDSRIEIPINLDTRSLRSAASQALGNGEIKWVLAARLMGASPPGQLVNINASAPSGYVGYESDDDDRFVVAYEPPASITGIARVRISLKLATTDDTTVDIGEVDVEVSQ